jgi:hypothetical protein
VRAGENPSTVTDQGRDRAVHQAEVDRVEEQGGIGHTDGAGGEHAAEAGERERRERLGAGVAVGLRDHHRRRDKVGRHVNSVLDSEQCSL